MISRLRSDGVKILIYNAYPIASSIRENGIDNIYA